MRMDDSVKFWKKVVKVRLDYFHLRRNTFLLWRASDIARRHKPEVSMDFVKQIITRPRVLRSDPELKMLVDFFRKRSPLLQNLDTSRELCLPPSVSLPCPHPDPLFTSSLYCESGKWENYQRQMLPLISRLISVLIPLDAITTSLLQLNNETTVVIFRWTLIQWKRVQTHIYYSETYWLHNI